MLRHGCGTECGRHVPGAAKRIINWLNCATYAHACTIVVSKRKKNLLQEPAQNILVERRSSGPDVNSVPTPEEQENTMLQAAWLDLQLSYDLTSMDIDVDLECLGILEQQMFELSLAAGAAGNEQWEKDAGAHQDRWNPYEGHPEHWNHGDRDSYAPEFEGEVDCGPNFSEGSEPDIVKKEKHTKKTKPRPRPRKIHKAS
ncbi:hypothetical protein DEU56DRAFT_983013 [Suillus clintonianus]|uniref:uncharacterized protein n=1 Tax=Suillus clintonianus TaxID=1904413 RepID=UPI001B86B670|nr:uncharacterized protein DEU56DRAFT_983013 [Suillus clintonianus]KAG2126237.1 hypothetical protein DEU56DRAFT_983013 [Suillus clintonianus]